MELDVPVYVLELKHPKYHAPSDDDIQFEDHPYADDASLTAKPPGCIADSTSMEEDTNEDSIDYPDEPEDGKEDDDEDPEEDPNEEHEPKDKDTKGEEPSKGSDETEPFEENKISVTPPPPRHRGARIFVRPKTPMVTSTQTLIDAFAAGSPLFSLPPTGPTFDQAPLESSAAAVAKAPKGQYDFVDTVVKGQGFIRSFGHDARTIARAADRVEDVGYVRALQSSEHRMMTFVEQVNLRTDCKDIRLEIDVGIVGTTKDTRDLHESYKVGQRQSAKDLAVTQMMHIYALEARARTDTNHAGNKTRNKRRHDYRIHLSHDRSSTPKKLYPCSGSRKPKFG
nr:hypothetical protein [Tanacetum cinerariifolium]GEY05139.1 hypothetical protein [Tanacetum cinerariifolium]